MTLGPAASSWQMELLPSPSQLSCSVAPIFPLFFRGCLTTNGPSPKKGFLFFQGHGTTESGTCAGSRSGFGKPAFSQRLVLPSPFLTHGSESF